MSQDMVYSVQRYTNEPASTRILALMTLGLEYTFGVVIKLRCRVINHFFLSLECHFCRKSTGNNFYMNHKLPLL